MKKSFFSSILILLLATVVSGADLQKTFTWKYTINKDAKVVVDNYDCSLVIHTWDKGEAEFHLIIDAAGKSDEDIAILDKYLQNMQFSNSANSVSFRNTFWERRNTVMGRTTLKLEGGKNVVLTDLRLKGELWIPSGCRFELASKYSEISMEDFSGPLLLDMYNSNIYGGNVQGKSDITDKYSTIDFKVMKDVTADLYNSKFETEAVGDLKIETKYSKVTSATSGDLDINSYNDKYNITKTGDIKFIAKYSDLTTESSGQIDLDCYEGTVTLKEAKDLKIISKYADFQIGAAGDCSISSSYNDKLDAGKLNSLSINESKYCSYRIDELTSSVTETDGYEDKFTIFKAGAGLKEVRVNGKYVDVSLNLPKTFDYRFKTKITYPKLDMDESVLNTRLKISEGSQLEYDAVKGTEKEGMPLIEINGYEMSLKITTF